MPRSLCIATLLVAISLALTACASSAAQATAFQPARSAPTTVPTSAPTAAPTASPTAAPTASPQPTAVPTLAKGVLIAGVAVGGLTEDAARAKLERDLAPLLRPLDVAAGEAAATLQPQDIGLELLIDTMLAEARTAGPDARLALQVRYDAAKLRARLDALAERARGASPPARSVLSSTTPISRSFALSGGAITLDLDAALKQIDERLRSPDAVRQVTLPLGAPSTAHPAPEELQQHIEAMAKGFKGVIGVYVYDLASRQRIAGINDRTAFTAASTIKVAILLNAYVNVPKFTAKQKVALQKMIVESDNLRANDLLAAAAGGTTTEAAFKGAEQMSAMLADLGLKNTFLYVPFESADFIKRYKVKYKTGPKQAGEPPFTGSVNTLRTTPYEMAQIYIALEQCRQGAGVLLEKYGTNLSPERCTEMIGWLEKNGDTKRMMSGLPKGAQVAHKSGWIPPQIQADAGIVRSPGGDFVIATYIYQPKEQYADKVTEGLVGSFARLVYSYYNPVIVSR